jgi:hypothetical protein
MSSISSCLQGHEMLYIARDLMVLGALPFGTRFALYFNLDQPLSYSETKLHHPLKPGHTGHSTPRHSWSSILGSITLSATCRLPAPSVPLLILPRKRRRRGKRGAHRVLPKSGWSKEQVPLPPDPRNSRRKSLESRRTILLYRGLSNMCIRMH